MSGTSASPTNAQIALLEAVRKERVRGSWPVYCNGNRVTTRIQGCRRRGWVRLVDSDMWELTPAGEHALDRSH